MQKKKLKRNNQNFNYFPVAQGLSDILLQGAQLPHYAAQAMVECRPLI